MHFHSDPLCMKITDLGRKQTWVLCQSDLTFISRIITDDIPNVGVHRVAMHAGYQGRSGTWSNLTLFVCFLNWCSSVQEPCESVPQGQTVTEEFYSMMEHACTGTQQGTTQSSLTINLSLRNCLPINSFLVVCFCLCFRIKLYIYVLILK